MLSAKLIQLIEANSASIIHRLIEQIRCDAELLHLSSLPDGELREWGGLLLRRLGHWLATRNEDELSRHYEVVGRTRFEKGVPLHEAVRGLFLVRDKMIEFVQEQAFAKTAVQLYAEGEFEHRVDKFFDLLI